MPKPPVDPGYFDKVNYVIDSWTRGCEAPWFIYVETMGPAALKAFITLMTFGWDDVARGFFRPRGLRSQRHRRKGKKTGRLARFFPEIGEEIGKRLPGATEVKGRFYGHGEKALWLIDGVIQRGLFWWLIADVTIDFAFNWTSLLYESDFCKDDGLGRFANEPTEDNAAPGGMWTRVHYDRELYEFPPPSWAHSQGSTGGVECMITAAVELTRPSGDPLPTEIAVRVVDDNTGDVLMQNGPSPPNDPDDVVSLVAGLVKPGTTFFVQVWHNASAATISGGIVAGFEQEV